MRKRLAILEIYHFYSLAMALLPVCLLTSESLIPSLLDITITAIRAFVGEDRGAADRHFSGGSI